MDPMVIPFSIGDFSPAGRRKLLLLYQTAPDQRQGFTEDQVVWPEPVMSCLVDVSQINIKWKGAE